MRLLHDLAKIHASFDDPNLVSQAGLVPATALAQRAGLGELAGEHVRIRRPYGVNAQVKTECLVAGMIAGADSIDDMGLLRHGAVRMLFGGVRAPSTLGSFLRSFTWGNVLQLPKVHRLFLAELAGWTPLLPGADVLAFVDVDSQQKRLDDHPILGMPLARQSVRDNPQYPVWQWGGLGLGSGLAAGIAVVVLCVPALLPFGQGQGVHDDAQRRVAVVVGAVDLLGLQGRGGLQGWRLLALPFAELLTPLVWAQTQGGRGQHRDHSGDGRRRDVDCHMPQPDHRLQT